jgi:lipid A 3-O-deacylase
MKRLIANSCLKTLAAVAFALVTVAPGPALSANTSGLMDPCLTGTKPDMDTRAPLRYDRPERSWYFVWENDAIALLSGSDEAYTQGMQLGYRYDPSKMPAWLARTAAVLCGELSGHSDSEHNRLVGSATLFFGQHFFTPHTISERSLIEDDRPYAAWLYGGVRYEVFQADDESGKSGDGINHLLELQLGITGPPAQGEFIQTNFHKLIGDKDLPLGWDTQIPTEFGLYLKYRGNKRAVLKDLPRVPLSLDVVPSAEVAVGNIQTYAQVGALARLGRNMNAAGAGRLGPTFAKNERPPGSAGYEDCRLARWFALEECYLFVGAVGRAIAYNAFVEGTLFHESHGVSKEPFVYDLSWGLRLRGRKVQIDYEFVRRSKEFSPGAEGAEERTGRHDYGSLTVTCLKDWNVGCPAFVFTVLAATFTQD